MSLGVGGSLNGFIPFPADNLWNQNISSAAVDPNSTAYINFIGGSTPLHPDFGSGLYAGQSIGIPYIVVSGTPLVKINFTEYGSESDPGPMPVPPNAPIKGYPKPGNGDRHVLVLDRDNCWLYELYNSHLLKNDNWDAGSAAIWDLLNDEQRPYTWTSADAAGLPVFPGLARYDEVAGGAIQHALRFTLQNSQAAFTPPASHWAANSTSPYAAPMGMRLRLKASYDISGFPPQSTVILAALQQYGMIMADNGSSMFITEDPDSRWDNNDLGELKTVPASAFEVVLMNPIYTQSNIPQGPSIASFTADPQSVSAGSTVTDLDRHQRRIQHRLAPGRSNARKFRDRSTNPNDNLHTLFNESVRENYSEGQSNGEVADYFGGAFAGMKPTRPLAINFNTFVILSEAKDLCVRST
jgi:hypothetical protein